MNDSESAIPDKRTQIIAGAATLFASDGYEGASMSRIAETAGVSKGTLYNHFDSKAELFAAWVRATCEERLAHIFDIAQADGDPRAVLRLISERMLRMILSDVGRTLYRVVLSEAAQFPDLARIFFDAGPRQALAHMSDWLEAADARGALRVPDPTLAAEQFFALSQTKLKMRRELMLIDEPSQDEIQRVVDASVEMFLNTYGP